MTLIMKLYVFQHSTGGVTPSNMNNNVGKNEKCLIIIIVSKKH